MAVMRMSRAVLLGIAGLVFAFTLGSAVAPASAQDRAARCQDYAREAVDQADKADRNRCGYSGPRWSNDRTGHFAWCMLSPRQAEDESRARNDDLRRCGGGERQGGGGGGGDRNREGKRASCDTYSSIAVVQTDANVKYRCGNRGPEWTTDKRGHFQWCMTNKREFILDEMRFRSQELQKCFNNLGDYDDDNYDRSYRRRF
jgi:hypothetical protein